MQTSEAQDQYAFIQAVLSKTGWSQTDLANRAGLDPSTLSRFLTKDRTGHALRPNTILRIAKAAGMPFGNFQPPANTGFEESEALPFALNSEDSRTAALRILSNNRNDVDAWVLNSRALENIGFKPNDILLVGLNEVPRAGDIVCAQIYDWAKDQAETVFRLYQPPALVGASNDPDFLKPFLLKDNAVVVKGVVLHSLRSR